jgi:hypothetical protein
VSGQGREDLDHSLAGGVKARRDLHTCTATDTPASSTTGTDPDMFQDPPPHDLFHRPGLEPPYRWKGRLLIAAHEVEEHGLQFWPA